MTKDLFDRAKAIRDDIDGFQRSKHSFEKIRERENDDEFNLLRENVLQGLIYAIQRLEDDFKKL